MSTFVFQDSYNILSIQAFQQLVEYNTRGRGGVEASIREHNNIRCIRCLRCLRCLQCRAWGWLARRRRYGSADDEDAGAVEIVDDDY